MPTTIGALLPRVVALAVKAFPAGSPGQHAAAAKAFSEDWIERVCSVYDSPVSDAEITSNLLARNILHPLKAIPTTDQVAACLIETRGATMPSDRLLAARQATAMSPDERLAYADKIATSQE